MVLVADIRALACNEPEVVCDMLRDALRHIGQIRVGPSSFEVLRLAVLGVDAALMARVNYLPNRTDVIPPQLLMLAAEIGMQALEIENLKVCFGLSENSKVFRRVLQSMPMLILLFFLSSMIWFRYRLHRVCGATNYSLFV